MAASHQAYLGRRHVFSVPCESAQSHHQPDGGIRITALAFSQVTCYSPTNRGKGECPNKSKAIMYEQ
jgi:hypothetical protein